MPWPYCWSRDAAYRSCDKLAYSVAWKELKMGIGVAKNRYKECTDEHIDHKVRHQDHNWPQEQHRGSYDVLYGTLTQSKDSDSTQVESRRWPAVLLQIPPTQVMDCSFVPIEGGGEEYDFSLQKRCRNIRTRTSYWHAASSDQLSFTTYISTAATYCKYYLQICFVFLLHLLLLIITVIIMCFFFHSFWRELPS